MGASFWKNPGTPENTETGTPATKGTPTYASKFLSKLPDGSSVMNMGQPPASPPPVGFDVQQAQPFQGPNTNYLQRPNQQAFFGG